MGERYLDLLGPALISLTGTGDPLRMHALLAYVNCKPTKSSVLFTWEGPWEFDQMRGSGRVTLHKDGRLSGIITIQDGDSSEFTAERSVEPDRPIQDLPSCRDKWRKALVSQEGRMALAFQCRSALAWDLEN